jgi:excisionase family DNA binding protein
MKKEELTVQEFVRKQELLKKDVLNPAELSEYTYIYKLTHLREIPFYCPHGKLIFFKRSEIDAWLLQNKRHSRREIESNLVK